VRAYVINLARSLDRRTHVMAELDRTGLDYEFITAVDGRTIDLEDRRLVDPRLLAKNNFPAGTAGCALSHLQAYRRILEDGADAALVLEDDVELPDDLGALAHALAAHLTGAEVVLLNYASPTRCRVSPEGSVPLAASRLLALPIDITDLVNAAAYVITRPACERMLESAPPIRANADDWHYFYTEGIIDRIRCVLPLPVDKAAKFESTIGLYSLGNGLKGRLVAPFVRHKVPLVHQVILYRRQRILRRWGKADIVDVPFVKKPSRLG
jgi:GR25 family glycosyltransferase involved in LPS biosynthesis